MAEEALQAQPVTPSGAMGLCRTPATATWLFVSLSNVEEGVESINWDIYDSFGERVAQRTVRVQDGFVNTTMRPERERGQRHVPGKASRPAARSHRAAGDPALRTHSYNMAGGRFLPTGYGRNPFFRIAKVHSSASFAGAPDCPPSFPGQWRSDTLAEKEVMAKAVTKKTASTKKPAGLGL
ncbi:MAG: hypothetical protein IPF41_05355 [Flavobacteriales bacterium]|nr:hypothetical protein [Flavobacteriales bacterium]